MKKLISTLALAVVFVYNLHAQSLIASVPASSNLVIKYAGENFKTLMPLSKVDSYGFIKDNLFNMLNVDKLTSVQNMGVDFEKDSYQYVVSQDSSLSFVTLINLKNAEQFLQMFKKDITATNKVEQKNGYSILALSDNTYVGWNSTKAVIVNTSYQYKVSYWDQKYRGDNVVSVQSGTSTYPDVVADTTAAVPYDGPVISEKTIEDAPPPPPPPAKEEILFTPPTIKKDGYKVPNKSKTTVKSKATTKSKTTKKPVTPKKKKLVEEKIMEIEESSAVAEVSPYSVYRDSVEDRKRELYDQQEDARVKKIQMTVADGIIASSINGNIKSIGTEVEYQKTISNDAHMSLWVNSDMLLEQYQNYFTGSMYRYMKYVKQEYKTDSSAGLKSGLNVYFQKDKIRVDQRSFSSNKEIEEMGKAVMNSKQNPALMSIINPDNLGYISMSINSEAMMNYYYVLSKKYLANNSFTREYSDVANLYIDLIQIMVDEKGIADLLPGNYMFVMHSMDTKMVDYIDYTYDSEYKSKQVKKSKKELSPNFTFAMDTRKEDFMQKLARLPIRYAAKENFNYKEKAGYYELAFDSLKYPVSSLYFMIKDGKGIVTTSKTVINNMLSNTSFATDEATKNSIMKNNYSIKVDMKKIFEITNDQVKGTEAKDLTTYMKNNLGSIVTESGYKDGMLQGTTIMNITGNHTNSLEFLFDMVQKINATNKNASEVENTKQD
jgi:Domain of unknown function (DUF4836)